MADVSRVLVYDHADAFVTELPPSSVFERLRTEVLNGERSLTVTTTVVLEREQHLLTCDATGKWREWVVIGSDAEHQSGARAFGTYYCQWSLQHDLTGTVVDRMPGVQTPVSAAVALEAALSGTSRWSVGTVTQTATGGASMYYVSGWEALRIVVDTWGGEVDAQVAVSNAGVITRRVALYSKMGSQVATRRFDYGRDLSSIRRKVDQSPVYCRIIPRGKGEDLGNGSYGRRVTIESVNGGRNYIENSSAAAAFRLPDGSGGWEYPTCVVTNEDIETPAELLAWGRSVISDYTAPKVTYEATVEQLSQAGMDVKGLALGDACQCVDRKFGGDGIRVSGRVTKLVVNELDEGDVKVTIGYLATGFVGAAAALTGRLDSIQSTVSAINGGTMSTADYLTRLIDRLNVEINGTGGYWYVIPGMGTRTYDVAVSDPAVGTEASSVVEVRGGNIRVASSKTATGEWEWRTLIQSGHIAAELVTAAHLTTGYIGSADSGNFIDLDRGEWRLAAVTSLQESAVTDVDVEYRLSDSATSLSGNYVWSTVAPEWADGKYMWQRTKTVTASGTSYSEPTCISGARGNTGNTGAQGPQGVSGTGVSAVVEQYYLSTSASTQEGGSWQQTCPAYVAGRYYWTRSKITWSDGTTTYTTPVLASGLNNANSKAEAAKSTADGVRSDFDTLNTQQGIFNALTNNGQTQGIYLSNGLLYINGQYIAAGTIADRAGKNSWDLETGVLTTDSMVANNATINGSFESVDRYGYRVKLRNGSVVFENDNGYEFGHITPAVSGTNSGGLSIVSNDSLTIQAKSIAVSRSSTDVAIYGFSGSIWLNNVVYGPTASSYGSVQFEFKDGIFTGVGVHTSGLVSIIQSST